MSNLKISENSIFFQIFGDFEIFNFSKFKFDFFRFSNILVIFATSDLPFFEDKMRRNPDYDVLYFDYFLSSFLAHFYVNLIF